MSFKMSDGSNVRSRILDSGGLLSVHIARDYDVPNMDWDTVRTIVDIGSHVGSFVVWAGLKAPNAKILAVEPNAETFQFLAENIVRNGLQGRVHAINAAVADKPGTASLELVEHSLGTRISRSGGGSVNVRTQTLAGLLGEGGLKDVDMLKVDCEGMEYAVLQTTTRECLRRVKVLACEYHPEPDHDARELDVILESAGFVVQRPNAPLGVLWATR
jgi:FkbM family methyltransferase